MKPPPPPPDITEILLKVALKTINQPTSKFKTPTVLFTENYLQSDKIDQTSKCIDFLTTKIK
jgi:hypothetical protein